LAEVACFFFFGFDPPFPLRSLLVLTSSVYSASFYEDEAEQPARCGPSLSRSFLFKIMPSSRSLCVSEFRPCLRGCSSFNAVCSFFPFSNVHFSFTCPLFLFGNEFNLLRLFPLFHPPFAYILLVFSLSDPLGDWSPPPHLAWRCFRRLAACSISAFIFRHFFRPPFFFFPLSFSSPFLSHVFFHLLLVFCGGRCAFSPSIVFLLFF